jgi:hypothetical protein
VRFDSPLVVLRVAASLPFIDWFSESIRAYTPLSPESPVAKAQEILAPRTNNIEHTNGTLLALAATG